jgi:hypothetical protein
MIAPPTLLAPLLRRPRGSAAAVVTALVAILLCVTPVRSAAQEGGDFASVEVPGGTAAFARVLGVDPDAPRTRLMLTAIRLMWDVPDGQDPAVDRGRANVRAYLETLAALERGRTAAAGQPVTLATLARTLGSGDAGVFAGALGCQLREAGRGRWRLEPSEAPAVRRRADWLSAAGVDVAALVTGLNAGAAVSLDRPSDSVPLPLPRDAWDRLLKPAPGFAGSLFTSLLSDRRGSFIYHGAAAMDGPTRAFMATVPPAVLYTDLRSPIFASLGRSVRVAEDGRLLVPGGREAEPLWVAVVGERVADVGAFVARLLERDDGRLALFYDGVSHAAPGVQRFVLGLGEPDVGTRLARFKDLVVAAGQCLAGWNPRARPFERVAFDVTHVLTRLRMTADGARPAGPSSRRFWEAAFASASLPDVSGTPGDLGAGEGVDAAWLIGLLCRPAAAERRDRAEAWMFAQRTFPAPTSGELDHVLIAVRGFLRFRTLVLTLERVGVTDPATYAQVVRAADRVSRAVGPRSWATVAQFQGAVALIERGRFCRALDARAADALLRSLAAVPTPADVEYFGGLAGWIDAQLLPAAGTATLIPMSANPDRPVETRVLAFMAGAVASSAFGDPSKMPTVEWEGLLYRVDPAGSTLRRMVDVRARQGGPSLDTTLAMLRALRSTEGMGALSNLEPHIKALSDAVSALRADASADDDAQPPGVPDLRRAWSDAERGLRSLRGIPSSAGIAAVLRPLTRVADWHLARVLVSLAYAPHLGEPDSPALLGGDPSPRHDFGLGDTRLERRLETMWRLPVEGRERQQRWGVTGSLLGLDVALGRFALRRVPSEVMPAPPMLTDVERQPFTEAAVLVSPFDFTDDARTAMLDALAVGRERLAAASPESITALAAEAGLDEWRTASLPWTRVHEPSRIADLWSSGELVRLGLGGSPPPPGFDAWGGSGLSVDGNLTCAFPRQQPWVTLSGRKGTRIVPALVPDLGIALAESLVGLHLPARLAGGVLTVATQAFLDTLRTNHDDDWMTLVTHARKMVADGIEDYVSALTIGGALVPADGDSQHANDR